jgi:hypothetical protein
MSLFKKFKMGLIKNFEILKKKINCLKRVNPQKYFFGHSRKKLRNISLAPFAPVQPNAS